MENSNESAKETKTPKKALHIMSIKSLVKYGTITSNDIHVDFTEDLLPLKDYDGRDDANNSRTDSMDNLISENIGLI